MTYRSMVNDKEGTEQATDIGKKSVAKNLWRRETHIELHEHLIEPQKLIR